MNYNYHHWYGEQINTTLAFLFFVILLLIKDSHALIDTAVIQGTIHMIVSSNVLSLTFRTLDKYEHLLFMNTMIEFKKYPTIFYNNELMLDKQYAWLYIHKSQYAFILLLCIAFFAKYRKLFRNIFTYILSQAILLVALFFSDVYTSMAAVLLIFIGQFLDYFWKTKWWRKILIILFCPLPLLMIAKEFVSRISENRDLLTLGHRTLIWKVFTELIQDNPNGMCAVFGETLYSLNHWSSTTNAHNIFLNHMFRFSIPVGGIYAAMFVMIALFAIKRNFSFFTIFTWIAIFIPLTMDHSLTAAELPFFLFIVYCMFFREDKSERVGNEDTQIEKCQKT